MTATAERIAVLLPSLHGGGAERSMLTLIDGFRDRGRSVDLLLCKHKGALLSEVPADVSLYELEEAGSLRARLGVALRAPGHFSSLLRPVVLAGKVAPEIARIPALTDYLNKAKPDALLSAISYANLAAIWANRRLRKHIPLVVSERIALASYCSSPENSRKWRWRYLPELIRNSYPEADAVVGVSQEVCRELNEEIGLTHDTMRTIYNPVVGERLREMAAATPPHEWLDGAGPPVILAAGRLTYQKDFATLIEAFAKLRATREARLVILGEGKLAPELEALAAQLGVAGDVDLPGFASNPFAYMARAAVFVLSSRYEGLSGVLIQALGCGCPVVSTDCPGGAAEILDGGRYGRVIPVGDSEAMSGALLAELNHPTPREPLLQRAETFSVDNAVDHYLALLDAAVAGVPIPGEQAD